MSKPKETLHPQVLSPTDTKENVYWFLTTFSPARRDAGVEYVVVRGTRYEMNQLNSADMAILRALVGEKPVEVR